MTITVRARKGSFWRAGIRHTETPVAYEEGAFTDEQLAALRAEPKLVVEQVVAGRALEDTSEKAPTKAAKTRKA